MALINCPECNKEISEKSKICIHCGFPLEKDIKNTKCNINGKEYDLSFVFEEENKVKCIGILRKMINCGLADAKNTVDYIIEKNEIPRTLIIKVNQDKENNSVKCPTCQSTNIQKISGGERVASVVALGIFSKKINKSFKCKSCGYTW